MSESRDTLAPDPGPILRLVTTYWESQTLLTAQRIGLFELLATGPTSADQVAGTLGLAARPVKLLLNACVGLGLLELDGNGYRNHPRSSFFLVPGSPGYMGNAVRYGDDMWGAWSHLGDTLRDGAPRVEPVAYTGQDPQRTRRFVYGMHERALGLARALVEMVDLTGRRRLLDIGGGPATYAALLTNRFSGLHATVIDLPGVIAVAVEILESLGARDRVTTLPGDYKTITFPEGNDVVLISGVLHRESEATCRALIRRARKALVPGGMLIVADVFTDEAGTTPPFAALFGLHMMLSAPDGGVHADAAVARWLTDAGFSNVRRQPLPPPLPHRMVVGEA